METQTKFEFIHPGIQQNQPEQCLVLIEVGKLRLNWTLFNRETSKILILKSLFFTEANSIPAIIREQFSSIPFDTSTLAGCKIAWYTRIFDLVPDEWLIPDERHHYLILNQPDIRPDQTLNNHLSALQISMISRLPDWLETLHATVPNSFELYHGGVLLIESRIEDLRKPKPGPVVHLHFVPDGLEILVLNQRKPEFYTYVESSSLEELLYLFFNVVHQLGLTGTEKIFYSGLQTPAGYFQDVARQYFKNIRFSQTPSSFSAKLLKQIKNLPAGEFDLLFQLLLCA